MPACSAFASTHGQRARTDRRRKVGLANAVATGHHLCRVGVLSESELFAIRRLAATDRSGGSGGVPVPVPAGGLGAVGTAGPPPSPTPSQQRDEARRQRTARLRDQRSTAALAAAESQRQAAAAEALLRLAEVERQEAEERQRRLMLPALQMLRDDPRGRAVRSLVMLNDALRDREAQVRQHEAQREEQSIAQRAEDAEAARGRDEEKEREAQRRLDARTRNVEEKNHHLHQVMFQLKTRREERRQKKEDRREVQCAAAEEREEEREEQSEARKRIAEIAEANRLAARPHMSRHERLTQRVLEEKAEKEARDAQEARDDIMKQRQLDRVAQRVARLSKMKELCALECQAERLRTQHVLRTQEAFEQRGTSVLAALAQSEDRAKRDALEKRKEAEAALRRRNEWAQSPVEERVECGGDGEALPRMVRRAAATRGGFMDREEERLYQEQMRQLPAKERAAKMQEDAARREEKVLLQRIHRLQAEEKRENERRVAKEEEEAHMRQQRAVEEDDRRYAAYIQSQLPESMHPVLYERAMKLHC